MKNENDKNTNDNNEQNNTRIKNICLYACKNGGDDDDDDDDEDSEDDDDLPTSNQKRSCEVTLAHPTTCMFKTCSRYLVLRQ